MGGKIRLFRTWNENSKYSKEVHVNNDQTPHRSAEMCSPSEGKDSLLLCLYVTSQRVKGRRHTDLLREAPRPQEKSQKTPDDHSQHRHDEEPILLAHVLHPHPHCVQSHGHRESPVLSATHKCAYPRSVKILPRGWKPGGYVKTLQDWMGHCVKYPNPLGRFKAPSGSASLSSSPLRQSALS